MHPALFQRRPVCRDHGDPSLPHHAASPLRGCLRPGPLATRLAGTMLSGTSPLRSPRAEDYGPDQWGCCCRNSLRNSIPQNRLGEAARQPQGSERLIFCANRPRKKGARHWNKTPGSPTLKGRLVEPGIARATPARIGSRLLDFHPADRADGCRENG